MNKNIKKITVRFPKRLKAEMQAALIKSGHGLHGKSRWLKEAIITLLSKPSFVDYVEQGININQAELTDIEAFYLDKETQGLLQEAFVAVRTKHPLFEGVQSAIVRAAVVYKLMLR